jgi:hypothetical protein
MLSLDEIIKGEEAVAEACEEQASMCDLDDLYARNVAFENSKCAERHRQIVEWLKELRILKKEKEQKEQLELSIEYLEDIKDNYIEGHGYERHPLPEYYAIEHAVKTLEQVLAIIDKKKTESEDKE